MIDSSPPPLPADADITALTTRVIVFCVALIVLLAVGAAYADVIK